MVSISFRSFKMIYSKVLKHVIKLTWVFIYPSHRYRSLQNENYFIFMSRFGVFIVANKEAMTRHRRIENTPRLPNRKKCFLHCHIEFVRIKSHVFDIFYSLHAEVGFFDTQTVNHSANKIIRKK